MPRSAQTAVIALAAYASLASPLAAFESTALGVGSGVLAGAVVAGPVGAVVGGVTGGYIGSRYERPRVYYAPRRRYVRHHHRRPPRAVYYR